ncbi:Rieske 2Fe-2S domain-containing protein [Oceanicella sp. SM1341]|uniref:Rieske (2Fe-2S) protein n=1 Tax=Oceanicella sp. SM1341 TaxID=1548889 RepID=UPI000E4CF3BA|nr:Rieske 2Fe-2S domain-containing protein [Oceanicella sp. SM1341]
MAGEPWKSMQGAPAPGQALIALAELEQGARVLTFDEFGVILLREGDTVRAFWNACPHQYLPLDWRSPGILSADGTKLMCSNHAAIFDARTGAPAEGSIPVSCGLWAIPVAVEGGKVVAA